MVSGKKTSPLILRLRVIAASPTGILAFSSMTTYSQPPVSPTLPLSTATTSKAIWRTGTAPKRFSVEVS
jgi:hypothetical protein